MEENPHYQRLDKTGKITAVVLEKTTLLKRAAIYVGDRLAVYALPEDAELLLPGKVLTAQMIDTLQQRYQDQGAYLQAVRFLVPRDRSTMEVQRHLRSKGWDPPACDRAVEKLKQEGYLEDRVFAEKWVAYRARTAPRSRQAMIQELKQKGLARETILAAVTTMDEEALALACAKKKVRQWLRYAGDERKKRVIVFLHRKGFPYDVCWKTARILVNPSQGD